METGRRRISLGSRPNRLIPIMFVCLFAVAVILSIIWYTDYQRREDFRFQEYERFRLKADLDQRREYDRLEAEKKMEEGMREAERNGAREAKEWYERSIRKMGEPR